MRILMAMVYSLLVSSCCLAAPQVSHGPMLGGVTHDQIRVWARTSEPTQFRVWYGTQAGQLDQHSAVVTTDLNHDCTGWVTLKNLKPGTKYHYELRVADADKGVAGTFRTLPAAQDYVDKKLNPKGLFNFRFEFACGNNQSPDHGNGPSLPTYNTLLRDVLDRVDFAILNGDWLYEEKRDYSPGEWRTQMNIGKNDAPRIVNIAPATVGVWQNYKQYMGRGKNLMQWHRHVPSFFTFDDHEIVNDVYGSGEIGRQDRRAVFRDIALGAWYDYLGWSNPTETDQGIRFGRAALEKGSDILVDPQARFTTLDLKQAANLHLHWGGKQAGVQERFYTGGKGDPNAGVFAIREVLDDNRLRIHPAAHATGNASYSIGRQSYGKFRVSNCDFFLLDTRTNRQMHDVRDPAKKGLSMLGLQQREWLKQSMQASDADFFFVVSSVNFMVPHIGGGGVKFDEANKDDAWTVFLDEREELIKFWDKLGKPVFVLTGDLHNSFAIKITDRVWEFASGPHNSVNHRPSDEGDRPATGKYQYGPRPCEIRWSTYLVDDIPRENRLFPTYCVVQVNNVFNVPVQRGGKRWMAYPQPQVIFQYYDGLTGDLRYAESISLTGESAVQKRAWAQGGAGAVETDK